MTLKRFLSTLLLLQMHAPILLAAQAIQPLNSIQDAIGQFIDDHFKTTAHYEYGLAQLDTRLRLPLCSAPLQIYSQSGPLKPGRNTIGVQCDGDKKWNIYTAAQIKAYAKIVVLSKPVRRGEIITPSHLTLQNQDIAKLHQGYLVNPESIIHKQAKHYLAAGTVVNKADFAPPKIIKRGEKVNILASSAYFEIRMDGVALTDGHKNQRIKVRNVNSKRIIQATVVKPGLVTVY